MKDAQKPDHVSLTTLVSWLREGRFVIPDFQREFEWEPGDISDLMRSIFLDYYIGSLLLWRGKSSNFEALSCESVYGYAGEGKPQLIVLDGQQRLTALYYAFFAPDVIHPKRANRYYYYIRVDELMEEAYDRAFMYEWRKGWSKILDDCEAQFEQHIFPLSIIGSEGLVLFKWIEGYQKHWAQRLEDARQAGEPGGIEQAEIAARNAEAFGEYILDLIQQYQIAYIELDQELEVSKVCDIFTQTNSKGVRLDVFDLINAMLRPKGLRLKEMWRQASRRLNFVETGRMNVYVLQVMSILQQAYCSPKYLYYLLPGQEKQVRDPDGTRRTEVLIDNPEEFEQQWENAVDALEDSIELLRNPQAFGAIKASYLPYESILPAFSALQIAIQALEPAQRLAAQRKLTHWYWASVFVNRYSGSVESTSARDYMDVSAWYRDDDAEPALLTEFSNRLRDLDLRNETRRGGSIYNGVFNLLVIKGARDWISGKPPSHRDLDDHHIVPKSWDGRDDVETSVDSILNRTPLTADTNRHVINDRLPNEYLQEMIERNGREQTEAILATHLISPAALNILLRKPFSAGDFDEFVAERQRTIIDAITNLVIKERIDLAPELRELDANVEKVELALRGLVDQRLGQDASQLPGHLVPQMRERMQSYVRKHPGADQEYYRSLAGLLEFSDLRELEQIITSKAHWDQFSSIFPSKGDIAQRFNQLAGLRNSIRHSRTVDDVTRMDGEAALAWFERVLKP